MKLWVSLLTATLALSASNLLFAETPGVEPSLGSAPHVVQHAEINPDVPVFVPVNPRIATTITFPKPIGAPVGTGFIDSEALDKAAEGKTPRPRGAYVIAYNEGDPFFTVQPLPKSEMQNLNVPYEGRTVVLFFYAVDKPLDAVASLIFTDAGSHGVNTRAPLLPSTGANAAAVSPGPSTASPPPETIAETETIRRVENPPSPPPAEFTVATPARLEGFLRKLRMIHAAHAGPELQDVANVMKLKVAVSAAEDPAAPDLVHPVRQCDGCQLILLRAVRDPAMDAIGFILLARNTTDHDVALDLRTFSARCGAALYTARVIDAPNHLAPGETQPGYFVIVGAGDDRPGYLSANNDWRLSVSVLAAPHATSKFTAPASS